MRSLAVPAFFAFLLVALGFALALNVSASPQAAMVAPVVRQPTASATLDWGVISAEAEAKEKYYAGQTETAQVQVAETRLAVATETSFAMTASAAELQIERERADISVTVQAVIGAQTTGTFEADMRTETATAAIPVETQAAAIVVLVSTETANREINATRWAEVGAGMTEFLKLVVALMLMVSGAVGLWYLIGRLRVDLEERRNRAAMIETAWGPAIAKELPGGAIEFTLLAPPPEARAAIAQQPRLGMGPTPKVPAVRADNPASPELERVLNLLAASMRAEGQHGHRIPRYEVISYNPKTRETLVDILALAGHVVVVANSGARSGTHLTNGKTLHQLWSDLRAGRATLNPLPHSSEGFGSGDNVPNNDA